MGNGVMAICPQLPRPSSTLRTSFPTEIGWAIGWLTLIDFACSGQKMGCIVVDPSGPILGATLPYLAIDIGDLKNRPIPPSRHNAVTCTCGRYLTAIMSSPMS